jgi:hypothetical protein
VAGPVLRSISNTFKSSTSKTVRFTLRPQIWAYIKAMASETSGASARGDEPITPKIFFTELLEVVLSEATEIAWPDPTHQLLNPTIIECNRSNKQKGATGEQP